MRNALPIALCLDRPRPTRQGRRILDFIRDHVSECGYPPSVRDIGVHLGLSSPSTVQHHLDELVRQGFIRRHPTRHRSIVIVPDGEL